MTIAFSLRVLMKPHSVIGTLGINNPAEKMGLQFSKVWFSPNHYFFNDGATMEFLGWSFAWIGQNHLDLQRFSVIPTYIAKLNTYPSALVLPHLSFDSVDLVLHGRSLLPRNGQLSGSIFGLFLGRISSGFSRLSQGVGIPGTGMHFIPLESNKHSSEDSYPQSITRQAKSRAFKIAHTLFYVTELLCGFWLPYGRGV